MGHFQVLVDVEHLRPTPEQSRDLQAAIAACYRSAAADSALVAIAGQEVLA